MGDPTDGPGTRLKLRRRCERSRPEDVPVRARQSGERHRRAVASLRGDPSLADIRDGGSGVFDLHARKRSRSMPAAAKT